MKRLSAPAYRLKSEGMENPRRKRSSSEDANKWRDEIPQELLDVIAQHIATPADFCRFGSVCTSWRRSAVRRNYAPQTFPWFMIDPRHSFYDISTGRTYRLHCLQNAISATYGRSQRVTISEGGQGWLVFHDPFPRMRRAQLINPLTKAHFNLPSLPTVYFDKMVVSSNPNKENDVVVFIHQGFGSKQYIIRHGDDQGWLRVDDVHADNRYLNTRFVSHKNSFYAINIRRGVLAAVDSTSALPSFMDIAALPQGYDMCFPQGYDMCEGSTFRTLEYLVSGSNDLFFCALSIYFVGHSEQWTEVWKWKVYKLETKNRENAELVRVESLEDGAIFIANKFSHYVAKLPTTFGGDPCGCKWKKNCIYFHTDSLSWKLEPPLLWECSLEDGVRKPFYSYEIGDRSDLFATGNIFRNVWLVPSLYN